MRESFIFYRSFADGLKDLDDQTFRRLMDAIINYALEGIEPDLSGLEKTVFVAWKANIDASNIRRDNGSKGGRPRKDDEQNAIYDSKTIGFENENHRLADEKPNKNVNVNVNENVNVNVNDKETGIPESDAPDPKEVKHKHGKHGHVRLTGTEYDRLCIDYGLDHATEAIDFLDEYIERKGYKSKSHNLAIRNWVFSAIKEKKIKELELKQREQRLMNKGKPPDKMGVTRKTDLDAIANKAAMQMAADNLKEGTGNVESGADTSDKDKA